MSDNRAVVVDPEAPGRLVLRPVPDPTPDRDEAIVRVRAILRRVRGGQETDGVLSLAELMGLNSLSVARRAVLQ